MIILIAGGTHTGKTLLAHRLMLKYSCPYLSIDHVKMGLIRSGYCALSPEDDEETLTEYLWPVVREIIKTAIENGQSLIVEGCYIPFDYKKDFDDRYLGDIRFLCLIFSREYIENSFDDILKNESVIERRLFDGDFTRESLICENENNLRLCREFSCPYLLIDGRYEIPQDAV